MVKSIHEIRDPIHVFVRLDSEERKAVDSQAFQRLRNIHQLALTYLVYPGATHKRFEHSLGVMELAGRVFDVVTHEDNQSDDVRGLLPELRNARDRGVLRTAVRMAALFHDVGHLPFSHAAEKDLLPEGWSHERLSAELIRSEQMRPIWKSMYLDPELIVKLALGPKEAPQLKFTQTEALLSEIIVGDAFGVDRMDYLLRDCHHLGVAYGKFDHYRLIDTLRILPPSPSGEGDKSKEVTLGVEHGGLQSAEALLLARYLMYSQVYCHPTRRIYDIHLKDFLREWLPDRHFSTDIVKHLSITDNEVNAALQKAAFDETAPGHDPARRIVLRKHFKVLWEQTPADMSVNTEARKAIFEAAAKEFGPENIRDDSYRQKGGPPDFPVQFRDGSVVSSYSVSTVLKSLPLVSIDFVFVDREILSAAENWLVANKGKIIMLREEQHNG